LSKTGDSRLRGNDGSSLSCCSFTKIWFVDHKGGASPWTSCRVKYKDWPIWTRRFWNKFGM